MVIFAVMMSAGGTRSAQGEECLEGRDCEMRECRGVRARAQ